MNELTLTWRGSLTARIPIQPNTTIADIISHLSHILPQLDTKGARLVWHGRVFTSASDGATLAAPLCLGGSRALVLASARGEAAALAAAAAAAPRLRDDLSAGPGSVRPRVRRRPVTVGAGTPGFGSLSMLPLPDWRSARRVLRAVASHPGVLAVMRARGWHVPLLREMPADGRVGVDPVCVLGLNVNAGAEIHLRLRTDDGKGFRKFLTIMQTVWHELAHNALGPHTPEFYALVSTLKREGEAADWRSAPGHTLAGRVGEALGRAREEREAARGGGEAEDSGSSDADDARDAAAFAGVPGSGALAARGGTGVVLGGGEAAGDFCDGVCDPLGQRSSLTD